MNRMRVLLPLMVTIAMTAAAAPPANPGWLGFSFEYHAPGTEPGAANGWMWVQRVAANGPAATAGLRPQDVIVALDGKPVRFPTDLAVLEYLGRVAPGQRLALSVTRANQTLAINLTAVAMTEQQLRAWQRNFEMARRAQVSAPPR